MADEETRGVAVIYILQRRLEKLIAIVWADKWT